MDYIRDFHCVALHSVHNDEWQRQEKQLARAVHPALPSAMRKQFQQTRALVNGLGNAMRCVRALPVNVFHDAQEVFNGGG